MVTRTITLENFEETIASGSIVLLDFWAEWCGPCRRFGPIFEAASQTYPDVIFGKVDTDVEQVLAQGFAISSIPTLMAFREGLMVFSQPGAMSQAGLGKLVDSIRELDMDQVRSTIAEASGAEANGETLEAQA